MTKVTFLKAITLFSSVSLVTLFLMYRTGVFDETDIASLQSSPNGGSMNNSIVNDTTPPKKDSTNPLRLSSSKVLILTDEERASLEIARLIADSTKDKAEQKPPAMFYGTKSGAVFKPKFDSSNSFKFRYDTSKKHKKKRRL